MIGQTIRLAGPSQRAIAKQLIDAAPDRAIVNIRPETRSNEQNAKMWAMLSDIARAKPQGRDMPTDRWKCLFMDAAGIKADWEPGIDSGVVNVGYRSSRMTVSQMRDMIECMYAYGSEHEVEWHEPPAQTAEVR